MKIIDPGHVFQLQCLDGDDELVLRFVKREGEKFPGNVGHHPGTILQECWRAEIARLKYLQRQVPCAQNEWCIAALRDCIYYLEIRAARRHGTEFVLPTGAKIEDLSTCPICGHVFAHKHEETVL